MTTIDSISDPNRIWSGRVIWGRNPGGTFTAAGVDSKGNLNVNIQANSDTGMTVSTVAVSSSSNTAVSLIPAGGAGIFNDIASIAITNESSTPTIVSLSDNGAGGNVYKFAIAANGGISYNPAIPLPQGTAAAAWNVLNSAGVALDYVVIYLPSTTAV
jgi:hypothetical protein